MEGNNIEEEMDILDSIKSFILSDNNEMGYVKRTKHSENGDEMHVSPIGAMPEKLYKLGLKHQVGFVIDERIESKQEGESPEIYRAEFVPYNECSEHEKRLIDERIMEVEKLKEKINGDTTGKYDEKGFVILPVYFKNAEYNRPKDFKPRYYLRAKMTKRELVEAGVLPTDFDWQKMQKPNIALGIADADKEQGLTKNELKGIPKLIKMIRNFLKRDKTR